MLGLDLARTDQLQLRGLPDLRRRMPQSTTFLHRIATDAPLLASVARMYVESLADTPACRKAHGWREQVCHLIDQYGREVVVEALMEDVLGLTMRDAVTLVDLAVREESGRMASV